MKKIICSLWIMFLVLVGCQKEDSQEKIALHFLQQYYTISESWLEDYHVLINDLSMSSETYGKELLELLEALFPDNVSDAFIENSVNSREYMILPDYLLNHDLTSLSVETFDIEVLQQEKDKVSYHYKVNIGVDVEGIVYLEKINQKYQVVKHRYTVYPQ